MALRLPHDETDPEKRYSFPDPDRERYRESAHVARYNPGALTKAQAMDLAELAGAYLSLTTYPLGQEHCVNKLRDIWRARRARKQCSPGGETDA